MSLNKKISQSNWGKEDRVEDWFIELRKTMLKFFINATPEDWRKLLKKADYQELTGIDPDTLKIRQTSAGRIKKMKEEYKQLCKLQRQQKRRKL